MVLSENLLKVKEEFVLCASELWSGVEERFAKNLDNEVASFWAVDLWNDLLYALMGHEFRTTYANYLKRYGLAKHIDGADLPLVREQLAEVLKPDVDTLLQTFQGAMARAYADRREEIGQVVPYLNTRADLYAQRVVDFARQDYMEKGSCLERQFALRLDQARNQQRHAEQHGNDPAVQKRAAAALMEAPQPSAARISREQFEALKLQHRKAVDESTERFRAIDKLRATIADMESAHVRQIDAMQERLQQQLEAARERERDELETVRGELREAYTKLNSSRCHQQESEDIAHHLDVLCEKLNLEVNWLLKVLRRGGIEREKIDLLQTQLQKLHYTGATSRPLAVPGGWRPGDVPDTAAPILARETHGQRAAPANVAAYGVLSKQIDQLKAVLGNEELMDEMEGLRKALHDRECAVRRLQLQLRHVGRRHDHTLRKLHLKYSEEVSAVSKKAFALQRKFFVHGNKAAAGRRQQYSTRALDELTRMLSTKEVKLHEANMEIWRLKRVAASLGQRATPFDEPPPLPGQGATSPAAAARAVVSPPEGDDESGSVGSFDELDAALLPEEEEEDVEECAVSASVVAALICVASTRTGAVVNCFVPPLCEAAIDTVLWNAADKEVQVIADAQLAAAKAAGVAASFQPARWNLSPQRHPHSARPLHPVKHDSPSFVTRMTPKPPSTPPVPRETRSSSQRSFVSHAQRSDAERTQAKTPVPASFSPVPPQKKIVMLPFKEAKVKNTVRYAGPFFGGGEVFLYIRVCAVTGSPSCSPF